MYIFPCSRMSPNERAREREKRSHIKQLQFYLDKHRRRSQLSWACRLSVLPGRAFGSVSSGENVGRACRVDSSACPTVAARPVHCPAHCPWCCSWCSSSCASLEASSSVSTWRSSDWHCRWTTTKSVRAVEEISLSESDGSSTRRTCPKGESTRLDEVWPWEGENLQAKTFSPLSMTERFLAV